MTRSIEQARRKILSKFQIRPINSMWNGRGYHTNFDKKAVQGSYTSGTLYSNMVNPNINLNIVFFLHPCHFPIFSGLKGTDNLNMVNLKFH